MSVNDPRAQRLPDDALLRIAEYLAATSSPAALPQIMAVHPTFLHVALSRLYNVMTLDVTSRAIKMLRRVKYVPTSLDVR
jgi:hypothetical protein